MSDELEFPFLANRIAARADAALFEGTRLYGESSTKQWDRIITNLFEIGFRLEEDGTIWVDDGEVDLGVILTEKKDRP